MLTDQLNELWSESLGDEDFRFELKAQQVAVDLAEVFARTNLTQQELADRLGWKKSRVSKVLHGATNLTLKTLFQMSEAMDSDFQVVFGDKSHQ
ncbi:MAG: helix-turn-helix domain-containing protein [Gammaproteobacteria bacterium]|nr:helix-turn-helix domain-containing protein [Gammaproteobacteria bacterium]